MNFYYILSTTFVYSETIENNEKEASFGIFLPETKKSARISTVRKRKKNISFMSTNMEEDEDPSEES